MSDWFSTFTNQALQFADSLADTLVSQAAEAQHQIEIEQNKIENEENQKRSNLSCFTQLPWETEDESLAILSQDLMENILKLSVRDSNFTAQCPNATEVHFNFKEFVPTAMRLLQIDSNLARIHSKLSPKMDEELFWFNYYCRIVYLRQISGIDGPLAKSDASRYENDAVLGTDCQPNKPHNLLQQSSDKRNNENSYDSTLSSTINANGPLPDTKSKSDVHVIDEGEEEELDLGDLGDLGEDLLEGDIDLDLDLLDLDDLDDEEDQEEEEEGGKGRGNKAVAARNGKPGPQQDASLSGGSTGTDSYEKVQPGDCRPSSSSGSAEEGDCSDAELEAQIARELAAGDD